MPDPHYELPELAALYDAECGWSEDRDFYLGLAGGTPIDILDLGCGTGLLCDAYAARGHRVVGADPAPAMLDLARRKPHSVAVDWVEATAGSFRSDRTFDLVVMTGHAFQVLLTDDAVAAALANMYRHLRPGARAVFESRDPALDWRARWERTTEVADRGLRYTVTRTVGPMSGQLLGFTTHYARGDWRAASDSVLRFMPRDALERAIAAAGLRLEAVYGDWRGTPFAEGMDEMVFVTRRP